MANSRCKKCRHFEFSRTFGSLTESVWHCRFGFEPCEDCLEEAEYNIKIIRKYYKAHPKELQLTFKFE